MSIFGRLFRIGKGKAHQGVEALEDATFETTLKQTIRDMETDLERMVRASAQALSEHNRLENQYAGFQQQAEEWKEKAKKALGAGREDLASKCLSQKQECDSKISELQSAVEQSREAKERLLAQREQLVNRIEKAKRDASTLIARKNAANAQKKIARSMAGIGDHADAFSTLERFSEKVDADEAEAKAYDQLATAGGNDALEKELSSLSAGSVDLELEALKAELETSKK
jgi:phage shock protein A